MGSSEPESRRRKYWQPSKTPLRAFPVKLQSSFATDNATKQKTAQLKLSWRIASYQLPITDISVCILFVDKN